MASPLAFLNGRCLPQAEAALPLHDAGFVFGATVTDLCRTIRHRLYRLPEHLARFRRSCDAAFIPLQSSDADITHHAEELVAHNAALLDPVGDLALVLFATPGPVGYYLGEATVPGERPTFGIHTFPLPFARYRPWVEHGVRLATPSVRQIPHECIDPHIKQRSRLHWWLASHEVAPGVQPLLLDLAGNVTETASSNFLLVRDGTLVAPPREDVLEGISLGVVRELAAKLGIPLVDRPIALEECYAADEAILTCTSYALVGVREINGKAIPWPGSVMRRLLDAWNAEVGIDLHGQIRNVV